MLESDTKNIENMFHGLSTFVTSKFENKKQREH